ncbi:MAG: DUF4159 domain-containing protein [Longimicrobiales bacterium]
MSRPRDLSRALALIALALILTPEPAESQRFRSRGRRRAPIKKPIEASVRGEFTFCRLMYQSFKREWLGTGWTTDYPDGDRNLPLRLSQLTKTDIAKAENGDPFHAVVEADEPDLYECPFIFASDVGTVRFTTEEREALRDYLLKGGFLWADDFWGQDAWDVWAREVANILPEYPISPVPQNHVLFHTLYSVDSIPQVPSIQYWYRSGRLDTSERGAESATPTLHGVFDETGRLMIVMTHNTDIADGWEREGEDDEFFFLFSPNAYAVGVNVILYALTH